VHRTPREASALRFALCYVLVFLMLFDIVFLCIL